MERQIAEAEDRYRRLVAASSDLVFLRKRGRILSANGAALRVLGHPLEDLLRYDLTHLAGAESSALLVTVLQEVEKGQACSNVQVQLQSKTGNALSMVMSAEMCMHNGESVMQIVMANITERQLAEEEAARFAEELFDAKAEAEESTRQLRQKHRELARLRDAVAQEHATQLSLVEQCRQDVRTPTAALHELSSLLDATGPTPQQRRYLDDMRTAVRALQDARFPELPATSSGHRSLAVRMQRMDVRQVILRLIDTHARKARQKGVALSGRVATDVPEDVISDPDRVTEILSELLANAVRHTLRGEILINVRLERRNGQSGALRCEVIDTGEGISQDHLDRIFLPYRRHEQPVLQTEMADGVGLALCRQIVERLGGTLGAESQEGFGSTFWCLLPFTLPVELKAPQSPLELPAAAPTGTLRVLIADDEEINRAVARRMMESLGCVVDVVNDGQEAVEAARSVSYALVILDRWMPGLDGFQAAAAIRTLSSSTPQLRIVAMSADMQEEDQRRYLAAGMDDTIGKPLKIERLRSLLAQWGLHERVAGARS
jgi:PAS domain S-box-containing protein